MSKLRFFKAPKGTAVYIEGQLRNIVFKGKVIEKTGDIEYCSLSSDDQKICEKLAQCGYEVSKEEQKQAEKENVNRLKKDSLDQKNRGEKKEGGKELK